MRGLYSLFLLVLLCAPWYQQTWPVMETMPLHGDYGDTEPVDLTWENWCSGEFQTSYDKWHRQHFGFSTTMVRVRNQVDYSLYGKVHAKEIVVGKEEYLFAEPYLDAWAGTNALSEKDVRKMAGKLLDMQNRLKKRGKTLVIVLAPGKPSFFPEFVPQRYVDIRKPTNNSKLMSAVFREVGINLLDFNHDFIAQKNHAPFPLFGKTGIHWSNYGALLSLQKFVAFVEQVRGTDLPDFQLRDVRLSKELMDPDGDLGELINLYFPIAHAEMAIVDGAWEPSEGHETLRLTAFFDSFFYPWLNSGIEACFRDVHGFYYDSEPSHTTENDPDGNPWNSFSTKEAAVKSVDHSDVILFLATEQNYGWLGFGYLDIIHDHLIRQDAGSSRP